MTDPLSQIRFLLRNARAFEHLRTLCTCTVTLSFLVFFPTRKSRLFEPEEEFPERRHRRGEGTRPDEPGTNLTVRGARDSREPRRKRPRRDAFFQQLPLGGSIQTDSLRPPPAPASPRPGRLAPQPPRSASGAFGRSRIFTRIQSHARPRPCSRTHTCLHIYIIPLPDPVSLALTHDLITAFFFLYIHTYERSIGVLASTSGYKYE